MKKALRPALVLAWLLLLQACSLPVGIVPRVTPVSPTQTPSPVPASTATPTETQSPTITATVAFTGQCAYMWANQELPEVSRQLSEAFQQAGLSEVEARASAYGENCMDPESNKVVRFAAMQTDFYLTIAAADTGDTQALGGWVEKVLPVIAQFPPGQVPGPNPGYIGIRFTGTPEERNLWFSRQKAQDFVADGVSGSALYEALRSP